ncbi:LpxI family protein, partial [Mycobacterium tuberculosis]|nr:LpxI family protein [Mycobacterium tuberculosis]
GVVVRDSAIVAREAVDGTDAMLARLADGSAAGGVLVKCLKPQQDLRLDLPAIGPGTVAGARVAGLAGIAVEAGTTLIADRAATLAAADASGLFIHGVAGTGGAA